MEKVMNLIKPKPDPKQILRDWQRKLRQECRNIERQIRDIQKEERTVQKAIKEAAKRNDMVSAKSAEVMKLVNNLMKAPQMAATMQEFSKEMTKAGVIEEFVNEAIDNALDSEDMEEEIDEEVDKVLTAIAGETAAELPEAVRKERIKVPAQKASTSHEEEAIAEGVDDEEELEEIRARLAKVRS
ncbi:unnamed protein product [Eruca vesicaria subsp. sativa]|uniref:Uncharacterized protein n=1 Tax=Eruca vesicaria subsp. sativa TaxID=29727 RepID=A0ABC8LVL7_ERUVS|nr:unnamed protein product [Eruca vesicaria subsp. sativa]